MNFKIEFSESFKNIVNLCAKDGIYIGSGNPDSTILIVGQESASEEREQWYNDNAIGWQNKINNNHDLIDFKHKRIFPGGHTWSKYQKLHNYIFPEHIPNDSVNFEERFFTTEMSDNPAKKNIEAKKNENFKLDLQNRKNTFFTHDFIQAFPVVVLACSNYIQNNDSIREIDNMFTITYPGDEVGKYAEYSRGNWFYLHFSEDNDKEKLVIHTRQLSTNVEDKMLEDMGKLIRQHLIRTGKIGI